MTNKQKRHCALATGVKNKQKRQSKTRINIKTNRYDSTIRTNVTKKQKRQSA